LMWWPKMNNLRIGFIPRGVYCSMGINTLVCLGQS